MILHKMNNHLFPTPVLHFIITAFCIFNAIPSSYSEDDEQYLECRSNYSCGSLGVIEYPFWGDNRSQSCGREGFKLNNCLENQYPTLESGFRGFHVSNINRARQIITIARDKILTTGSSCSEIFQNITLDQTLFKYGSELKNLNFFYDCKEEELEPQDRNYFTCPEGNGGVRTGFYTVEGMGFQKLTKTCHEVMKIPVQLTGPNMGHLEAIDLRDALNLLGYDMEYYFAEIESCTGCVNSEGTCGSDAPSASKPFVCLCPDGPHSQNCTSASSGGHLQMKRKIVSAVIAMVSGIILACLLCICYFKLKISSITSSAFLGNKAKNEQDIEAFVRNFGSLAPKRYKFSDVKKMTNSFKDKLGQGGYGSVYKGKLPDGHIVAVKLLNTSKGNGQEFINEVASISRTSHVNVVTLLGFCLEGSKRALIYEFMSNGSLDKFIYTDDNLKISQHLGWEKMYQIAIEIARGLAYLHRDCNTRILHFDIKPHNILLDEDFCPKISDFGLAKLCANNESIVSMLEARGTIGYIAPEVFSRNFGVVSHKSDVYSYGMMVLEMVGGKKDLKAGVVHTSEIYFPHWIYKHVEQGKEFEWHGANTNEENTLVKKMIIISLWCIQTRPSDRPSMNKVIDMLQGSIEALQIPPEPFLSSPPRSLPMYSSTTSI